MLRGQILSFIKDYLELLSSSLAAKDGAYRLTSIQKCWLGFCISGILLTNSVCWAKFSRAGMGSWLEKSLSWMFGQSKINWEKLFEHSIDVLLKKYDLTEGSLEIDDTERERSKNSKEIYHLGHIYSCGRNCPRKKSKPPMDEAAIFFNPDRKPSYSPKVAKTA